MFRRGNFREKFGQRLGLYTDAERTRFERGHWIWIHSISVGETLVALKLARELRGHDLGIHVALSVTTSTGFALARQSENEWMEVIYNPIDFLSIVREAIDTIRPAQLILIEGEVWPNLVAECRRRGIRVSLANARLSPRSESRFRRFRAWTGPIFQLLDLITVPEPEDIARWSALGVDPPRVHCTGSIKFDLATAAAPSRADEFRALLVPLGIDLGAPILLGGSTWSPEEKVLAEIFLELRREHPDLFLILVPRHVERTAEIERELLSLGLGITRRSTLPSPSTLELRPSPAPRVLLVDTTGELRDWYELATIVFVGKSLPEVAQTGGQNPAEPAAVGKPVVFGPHMENFAAVVSHLLAQNAAVQIASANELRNQLQLLLTDKQLRQSLVNQARAALAIHQDATARAAALLLAEAP